ncbi:MAG: hypothetical protein ABIJ20_03470 [Nanoarchaeota archaeon]|nr:hypothetical protein [Nanoarchaeota archaeon]MBU1445431.1 hypothetical protein [Nanoarchaeota archaeon]MBU2420239.1 hypothetical protein [Nanoarchaeota archaeon]MBU2474998.1 hypothetical protein [Nanoarchaeota archaeon]
MIKVISFDWNGTLVNFNNFDKELWDNLVPKLYSKKYNLSFKEAQEKMFHEYNKKGSQKADGIVLVFGLRNLDLRKMLRKN